MDNHLEEKEDASGQCASTAGLGEAELREGFYEKMWKDFISLQRGDATLMCRDAARYRWLRDNERLVNVQLARLCGTGSPEELDEAIDAAMLVSPNDGGKPQPTAATK